MKRSNRPMLGDERESDREYVARDARGCADSRVSGAAGASGRRSRRDRRAEEADRRDRHERGGIEE